GWLGILNQLRNAAPVPGTTAPDPADLPALSDPGASLAGDAATKARVDTMFTERAAWLFLTAHRQGDLRRLIRQYGRRQDQVYPAGVYQGFGGTYGTSITLPVPVTEAAYNPYYSGCFNLGA